MARRSTRLLWILTGFVLLVLLAKFFVADVYRVDSGSMRPTLFGGRSRADAPKDVEHVLVRYERRLRPERFDLVVIRSPDGKKPLVKRVCGLPGDQDLMIRNGDLFVGRERLPADVPRPPLVPIYDDRYFEPLELFEHRRDGSVRREAQHWIVEGEEREPGNMLAYHLELRDDYLDRKHERVPGLVQVNDARLEIEFLLESPRPGQVLRFHLVEEGDVFEALLEVVEATRFSLALMRQRPFIAGQESPVEAPIVLAREDVELEPGRWIDLSLSNIDNHLRLHSRALGVDLRASYARNRHWPVALPMGVKSRGPRIRFGTQGGRARFRGVRIQRDLYYTDAGTFGSHEPLSLGPEDYFLLGDNSAASTDSRHFGPVKAARLLGRPVAVVWPQPHLLRPSLKP